MKLKKSRKKNRSHLILNNFIKSDTVIELKEALNSDNKNIYDTFKNDFSDKDFAITDLSHSRTIIEIEGSLVREVIKKGSPLNINDLKEGDCSNSIFHAITITLDFLSDNPELIRILCLRSFGESLYHSLTDACLEFGYKSE